MSPDNRQNLKKKAMRSDVPDPIPDSNYVQDLLLARACAEGNEEAWIRFVEQYRDKLYAAAFIMAKDHAIARELADSLLGDLFGAQKNGSSKLTSYTGRGSLEKWLKATLAQRYIDRYREQRRLVSLDEHLSSLKNLWVSSFQTERDIDQHLEKAVSKALSGLTAEERFTLASHFLDGRNLAEIARMLGVHESTVSRRIEKITTSLRKSVLANLRKQGLSPREAKETLKADVRDLALDFRTHLLRGGELVRE